MARQETILSVFVASPDDVAEERNRLEDVIRELNATWSRSLGVRLELIRWETDASPGFGTDPQAVINDQIPQDYDLFIGLMWYRFGTPTARSDSGTFEEFVRAKRRYDADPNKLRLMIYFKDAPAPVSPSQIDPGQIKKISNFRKDLGEAGGLYWSFRSADEFEKLVRMHISRYVQEWVKTTKASTLEPLVPVDDNRMEEEKESGFLDLVERFEDESSLLKEVLGRMADATNEVGDKMEVRTADFDKFMTSSDRSDRQAAKRLFSKAAADMDQFVHRVESELPLYNKHMNAGMDALAQTAALSVEFKLRDIDVEQVKKSLEAICKLRMIMDGVESSIIGFRDATASIPRMTTTLNRSKRAMVDVIQKMIDGLRGARAMVKEAEASFESIIKDHQ